MKRDYINHVCAPISSTYNTWGLMEDRRKLNGTTPYLGHNLHTIPHISYKYPISPSHTLCVARRYSDWHALYSLCWHNIVSYAADPFICFVDVSI